MKVKDLIGALSQVDEDQEVLIRDGQYVYIIDDYINIRTIRAAFGKDYQAVVLRATEQVGGVQ